MLAICFHAGIQAGMVSVFLQQIYLELLVESFVTFVLQKYLPSQLFIILNWTSANFSIIPKHLNTFY